MCIQTHSHDPIFSRSRLMCVRVRVRMRTLSTFLALNSSVLALTEVCSRSLIICFLRTFASESGGHSWYDVLLVRNTFHTFSRFATNTRVHARTRGCVRSSAHRFSQVWCVFVPCKRAHDVCSRVSFASCSLHFGSAQGKPRPQWCLREAALCCCPAQAPSATQIKHAGYWREGVGNLQHSAKCHYRKI